MYFLVPYKMLSAFVLLQANFTSVHVMRRCWVNSFKYLPIVRFVRTDKGYRRLCRLFRVADLWRII